MNAVPNSLAKSSAGFQGMSQKQVAMAMVYALRGMAGNTMTPNQLAAAATCFGCPSDFDIQVIKTYLLWQIAGGSTAPVVDPDVAAFISCSGITDPTQIGAVTTLVASLKSASLWASFDAIYPFVGGNAVAHSCNLKNPNTFSITWHGGVTHNASGVTGTGAPGNGYGDTGFNPVTANGNYSLNSASIAGYVTAYSGVGEMLMGAITGGNPAIRLEVVGNGGTPSVIICVNDANPLNGITGSLAADIRGLNIATRTSSTSTTAYSGTGLSQTFAGDNSTSMPNLNIYVLAENQGNSPFNPIAATCSLIFIGSSLSAGQAASLQSIANTYETTLGRA